MRHAVAIVRKEGSDPSLVARLQYLLYVRTQSRYYSYKGTSGKVDYWYRRGLHARKTQLRRQVTHEV